MLWPWLLQAVFSFISVSMSIVIFCVFMVSVCSQYFVVLYRFLPVYPGLSWILVFLLLILNSGVGVQKAHFYVYLTDLKLKMRKIFLTYNSLFKFLRACAIKGAGEKNHCWFFLNKLKDYIKYIIIYFHHILCIFFFFTILVFSSFCPVIYLSSDIAYSTKLWT